MSQTSFRVLHVCTGNICRSPIAEHLMRDGLGARLGDDAGRFVVESAGTWGHDGSPMEPHALSTLAGYAVDGSAFRARELVAEQVVAADLVLAATREHRAAAVVLHPRAAARTFTLREFARLVAALEPQERSADVVERARGVVAAAAARRGQVPPARPAHDDDLEDPYHSPERAYLVTARLVDAALSPVLDVLTGRARG